jgi:hypothetical protein
LVCFWCSLKYTHAMNFIFGYVSLYGMSRSVAKVFDVYIFSYDFCKLYASLSLMLFIAPLIIFYVTTCVP